MFPIVNIYKHTRASLENLLKPLLDSMEGVLFENDCKVVEYANIVKMWGHRPEIKFELQWFKNPQFKLNRYRGVLNIDPCSPVNQPVLCRSQKDYLNERRRAVRKMLE